jgi:PDZ domain-containing protein
LLGALVVATIVVLAKPVPYVAFSPGRAQAVEPLITVEHRPGDPKVTLDRPSDDLLFLTVAFRNKVSGLMALWGWWRGDVQVEPSKPYLGTQSTSENRRYNLALMVDSQDKARKVALERLGYQVKATKEGAFIEDVDPDAPAAAVIDPGTTVVEADGQAVEDRHDLVDAIARHRPGQRIELEVVPLGATKAVEVEARLGERPGEPGKPMLGVTVADRATYTFPIDIEIDTGRVGGPSAGLAFTLAILDRFTPGSLTGDARVAVTGTIEVDGSVGPVGGVRHKAAAAIREGATVFLVPRDELAEARKAAGDRLKVVPVDTLDDALAELRRLGGAPLPDLGQ